MQFFLSQNTGSWPIKSIVHVRLLTGKSTTAYSAYSLRQRQSALLGWWLGHWCARTSTVGG